MNGSTAESQRPGERGPRKFLARACGILAAPLAVVTGYPLVASLVGTIYRRPKLQFSKAPGYASAPEGQPITLSFTYVKTDAYLRTQTSEEVWVIKHTPSEATVFSPLCPHMGCRCDWHPELKKFICPCHGSIFSITGKVEGGPSPRPLDTLAHNIEDGDLHVQWELFETGIAKKIRICISVMDSPIKRKPRLRQWVEKRRPVSPVIRWGSVEQIPGGAKFAYVLGSATLVLFAVLVVTGVWQLLFYVPMVDHAYDSVMYLRLQVPLGWLVHGLHYGAAQAFIVVMGLHVAS